MKHRQLGKNGPKVSALGLGCMGMSVFYGPTDENMAIEVIHRAYEEGITLFDTADMYGNGANETLLGKAVKEFRKKVVLSTKCGIEFTGTEVKIHNSPDYIQKCCHASLKRLGTEVIDVYYLHRVNPIVPIEESMQAMQKLIKEGKILYVGLSEVDGKTLERAHKVLGEKLVALQSEYSLLNHHDPEIVLPTCRKLKISLVAHAPLGRGLLGGRLKDSRSFTQSSSFDVRSVSPQFQSEVFEHNLHFVDALAKIAKKKKCTVAQLCLAWLLAQGDDIIPIPGTKRMDYLQENLGALQVVLSQEDLAEIKQVIAKHPVKGQRLI